MIRINLLPEEVKNKRIARDFVLPKVKVLPFLIGFGITLVALQAFIFVLSGFLHIQINKGNVVFKNISPKFEELKKFKNDTISLSQKTANISEASKRDIFWWQKLNNISDAVPNGLWLTNLFIEKKNITQDKQKTTNYELIIDGNISPFLANHTEVLKNFIENLKNNPDFIKDFTLIDIMNLQRTQAGDREVVTFSIKCCFKETIKI